MAVTKVKIKFEHTVDINRVSFSVKTENWSINLTNKGPPKMQYFSMGVVNPSCC